MVFIFWFKKSFNDLYLGTYNYFILLGFEGNKVYEVNIDFCDFCAFFR